MLKQTEVSICFGSDFTVTTDVSPTELAKCTNIEEAKNRAAKKLIKRMHKDNN
jgi:hypothetical protein